VQAAVQPVEAWQWVYGLVYSAFWIWILYLLAKRAFDRSIVGREGKGR
jgi:fluoroquinolone transport system permease protein